MWVFPFFLLEEMHHARRKPKHRLARMHSVQGAKLHHFEEPKEATGQTTAEQILPALP
jgi:hypothetical protein